MADNKKIISLANLATFMDKFVDVLDERYGNLVVKYEEVPLDKIDGWKDIIAVSKEQKEKWDKYSSGHEHKATDIKIINNTNFPGVNNLEEMLDALFQYASNYKKILEDTVAGIFPESSISFDNISGYINFIASLPSSPLDIEIISTEIEGEYVKCEINTYNGIFINFGSEVNGKINWDKNYVYLIPDKLTKVYAKTVNNTIITSFLKPII